MRLGGQTYNNPLQRAANKYLFNGKELQDDLGLNLYDFGARMYDPQIGRWHRNDPLSESYYSLGIYNFANNNPVMNVDLDGKSFWSSEFLNRYSPHWTDKLFGEEETNENADEETSENSTAGLKAGSTAQTKSASNESNGPGYGNFYITKDGKLIYRTKNESIPDGARLAKWAELQEIVAKQKISLVELQEMSAKGEPGAAIMAIGFTGTASAIVGGSFEIGAIFDFRNGFKWKGYGTLEFTVGVDYSLGGVLNFHQPLYNNTINIHSPRGWGESHNMSLSIFDATLGGGSHRQGLNPRNWNSTSKSFNTYGFGVSAGSPFGYTYNKGYTWILD